MALLKNVWATVGNIWTTLFFNIWSHCYIRMALLKIFLAINRLLTKDSFRQFLLFGFVEKETFGSSKSEGKGQ